MISLLIIIFCVVVNYANCLYEDCDHNYSLNEENELVINSPGYPDYLYDNGSSCRYIVKTSLDYAIELSCYIDVDEVNGVNFKFGQNNFNNH